MPIHGRHLFEGVYEREQVRGALGREDWARVALRRLVEQIDE